MTQDTRQILYQNFDRKVGNPFQFIIHNTAEMNRFINVNSGVNDECYASVCSYQQKQPVFDDLFLEEDNKNIKTISAIGQYYSDNDIPLFSGNRGFQIHALFQPEIITHTTVKKFAVNILRETHNEATMDEHVTGDLTRLARIPNTQRINGNWCIPLSYENTLNQIPFSQVLELSKSPQFINYNITHRPKITEFVKECNLDNISPLQKYQPLASPTNFILKDFVRNCIYEKLCSPNPSNMIRNAATRDALLLGLTPKQLLEGYSELNWIDFDPSYSKERIDYINNRISQGYVRPFGKERLGCTRNNSCFKCLIGAV